MLAIVALLAVLAARAGAQPFPDEDGPAAPTPDEDWLAAAPDDDAKPPALAGSALAPGVTEPGAAGASPRLPAHLPPISAVVAAAYRAADLDRDPGPSWRKRARLAALVPWISVRGGQDAAWHDTADPTIGYVDVVMVSATWHFDRLVFEPNELRIAGIEAGRRRERRRIADLAIRAYYAWSATGDPEPAAFLDALTDGWFARAVEAKPR